MSRRHHRRGHRQYVAEPLDPRILLSAFTVVQIGEQDFSDGGHLNLNVSPFDGSYPQGANEPEPFRRFNGADGFSNGGGVLYFPNVPSGQLDGLVLQFGVWDHDSQAPGNQVRSFFFIDGVDFTESMNALLNSRGGSEAEYNIYTYELPPSVAGQADADFGITFQGPSLGAFGAVYSFGNGIALDFARLGPKCAINLPPLNVEGEFHHNATLDRCESTGTVLIGNGTTGPQIQVTGGTVWLNQQTLEATGTFSGNFGGTWRELFTGTASIALNGSKDNEFVLSEPAEIVLPATMRPAALPIELSSIRMMPTEVQLEGTFDLPEIVGGLDLTPQHFLIGNSGLTLPGGSISVPNVDVSLFGLKVKTDAISAGYNATENEIELSGSLEVKLLGDSGPSVTATFPAGNGIGIGPDGVDFNGSISASDLGVVPGLFTLKNLTLAVNVQDSVLISIGGSAKVKLPSGVEVAGSFNILNGQLDAVSLSGGGLKFPIGTTGLLLQRVGGSVTGLADGGPDPTFAGSVGFSYGPEYDIHLPAAFGGDFERVSLLSIDLSASATIDFFDFANSDVILRANCAVKLLGGVATGTGSISMDFRRVQLEIDTTFTALAGFITAQSHLHADASLNLSANASAALTVPASVPLIGGTQLFGGRMFFNYTHNSTLSDDYIAGYADIATWFGTFRTGARVNFDGTSTVLGLVPISEAPSPGAPPVPPGGPAPAPNTVVGRSFTVPAGSRFIVLSAAWANAAAGDVPLRVRAPNGTVYTPANFGTVVDYVDQFTSTKRATVAVDHPAAGTWTLELTDADPLGALTFEAFNAAAEPAISFTSPAQVIPGGAVPITYQATAPNAGTKVSLYYDTDGQGFDGRLLVAELAPDSNTYVWDTSNVAPGAYRVYAIVTDGVSAPAFAYAPGAVRVGDELPRPLGPEVRADAGFDAIYRHDVAADAAGNFVVVWIGYRELAATQTQVFARRFNAAGAPLGDEFVVSDARLPGFRAAVAMDAAGGFVVTWDLFTPTGRAVVARRYGAAGQPLGDAFDVSGPEEGREPAIQFNAAGEFAIVWSAEFRDAQGETLGYHVMLRRYSAAGVALGPATPVSTDLGGPIRSRKYNPSLAATNDSWVVAWGAPIAGTANNDALFARVYELDGTPRTGEIPIADDLTGGINLDGIEIPFVDAAPDGRFVVAWAVQTEFFNLVEARRFDANGAALGATLQIPGLRRPDVLVNADGSFLIAGADGPGGVYARRYDRDGNALSTLFPLFSLGRHNGSVPVLAARGATGGFVATWRSNVPDVHVRVFDAPAALIAPRIASGSFGFETRQALTFTFNKDVRDSIALADLVVINLDTGLSVAISGFTLELTGDTVQPTTATWRRTTALLPDGNYRATLPGSAVVDAYGNTVAGAGLSFDFFVFAADANHDRTVDFNDLVPLAQNYNGAAGKTFPEGDFNYDGSVDFNDLVFLAQRYNTTLAPPPPLLPPPAPAAPVTPAPTRPPARTVVAAPAAKRTVKPVFSTRPVATRPLVTKPSVKSPKPSLRVRI